MYYIFIFVYLILYMDYLTVRRDLFGFIPSDIILSLYGLIIHFMSNVS